MQHLAVAARTVIVIDLLFTDLLETILMANPNHVGIVRQGQKLSSGGAAKTPTSSLTSAAQI